MQDQNKTKEQLIDELHNLRVRLTELERERADLNEAEAVRREREESYRQMAENIDEVLWIANVDITSITYVSPAYEKVWGQPCESLYADPGSWRKSIHPEDRQRVVELLLARGTGSHVSEYRIIRPDGDVRWILDKGFPVRDASGEIYRMAGIVEDITELKRAEELEKKLRTQLANALEMAHLGPWEYDVVNDIFTFNDHFYKIFRTSAEKVGGYTMSSAEYASRFVHPEDMHVVSEEVRKVIGTSEPDFSRKFDHRILYEDGTTGFMSVQFYIVKDSHGKTIKTYGVNQDISERKRAEEALRESEERFYSLFSNMVEGVALHELVFAESGAPVNYRIIDHNVQYEKILGLRREDVLGKLSTEVYHTPEPPFLREYSNVALSGASACLQEYFAPMDRHFDISITPWGDKGFATIFSDVTERKKAEVALRESEQKYRELVESANSAIIRYKSDGAITFFNEYAQNFFGYREEKILGKHIGILLPDQDSTGTDLTSLVQDIISHPERHVQNVNENVRSDGTRVWVAWTNKPILTEDGNVAEIFTVGTDITELRRADQEREQLQQQLLQSQRMESVGRLAGGVAHDYNNMLGVIIGYTEITLDSMSPDDPLHANLREVLKAAKKSADITRQLLAFARKQTISPVVLDLNETVEGMLKMLRRLIGEDIDLAWYPKAGLSPVKMDPSQIDQILANLCVNARDAIAGVGKVTIETDTIAFDEAYCAAHIGFVPGEFVLLVVSDNGSGIEKETLESIFEPFFTTKEVDKGTGLGLSTVYGIVKQNGGFIDVYSEPGNGTTFKIYLPSAKVEVSQEERLRREKRDLRGTETVLLVEDEGAILALGKAILERHGYKVLAARNPSEALRIAGSHGGPIHLLITDVVMPEMHGRELRNRLQGFQHEFKCIYMSGYTANVIAHHGVLEEGINFLQKPFSVRALAEKVRNVLDA